MTYECRRHVRSKVIKVRLNDEEHDCVLAFSRLSRKQRATLAREWMLAGMNLYASQKKSALDRPA
ncbi:MAG: hypothetical protein H6974_13020 [Gammaproteobacteria bacterium]|nr:hypothetical protein [Gammaproteobacteria bacterium]